MLCKMAKFKVDSKSFRGASSAPKYEKNRFLYIFLLWATLSFIQIGEKWLFHNIVNTFSKKIFSIFIPFSTLGNPNIKLDNPNNQKHFFLRSIIK